MHKNPVFRRYLLHAQKIPSPDCNSYMYKKSRLQTVSLTWPKNPVSALNALLTSKKPAPHYTNAAKDGHSIFNLFYCMPLSLFSSKAVEYQV